MTELEWIMNWFDSQCDGDWEHEYGIKIITSDNPGWIVRIDLAETELEKLNIEYYLVEKSEQDWYGISIKKSVFEGVGDTNKLSFILNKFKELVDEFKSSANSRAFIR